MRVGGNNEVLNNLAKVLSRVGPWTKEGVTEALEIAKANTIPKTPIDMGDLRAGFKITVLGRENRAITGMISNDLEYAAVQHENLEFNHTEGEAKYLEKGVMQSVGKMYKAIVKRLAV